MRPLEATYLAWLDLRAYGHDDPAAVALDKGRVQLEAGPPLPARTWPATSGVNLATSPERLTEIVRRLATALGELTQPACWRLRGDQVGVPAGRTSSASATWVS